MLSTLMLSAGTPMLLAGDERWRTQRGNNNPYCQDNPVSWVDWSPDPDAESLTAFISRLVQLRRGDRAPSWDRFYRPVDVTWWRPDGSRVSDQDWHDGRVRTVGMLSGKEWLLVLHGGVEAIDYRLPDVSLVPALDSSRPDGVPSEVRPLAPGDLIRLPARSTLLFVAP
jgi:glycogen operon protein